MDSLSVVTRVKVVADATKNGYHKAGSLGNHSVLQLWDSHGFVHVKIFITCSQKRSPLPEDHVKTKNNF